jgi:hypothetical protein
MQKKVLFRSRQNVTYGDLNNAQDYAQKAFDDLIYDTLISGRGYSGFETTKATSSNLSVEPGRLYDTGKSFAADDTQTISLTPYIPAVAKKIVTLVVYGQTIDEDIEPRDFLINVTTRATEPQSVPLTRRRKAIVSPVAGVEAADPLPPALQAGYVAVATVVLTTSGIESVVMRSDTKIQELDEQAASLSMVYNWQNTTGKIIDGLRTDLSNLAAKIKELSGLEQLAALAKDVSSLKEKTNEDRSYISQLAVEGGSLKSTVNSILNTNIAVSGGTPLKTGASISVLPDLSTLYGYDDFLLTDKSDTTNTAAGYSVKVEEGLRFAPDAQSSTLLAVNNPYNGQVTVNANGLMVPNYTSIDGLVVGSKTSAIAAELPLADYQYTTWEFVKKAISRQRIRYGDYFTVSRSSDFWRSGKYDSVSNIFTRNGETFEVILSGVGHGRSTRLRKFWFDSYEDFYWEWEPTTSTVQGAQIAQTFLNAQARYCTGISLAMTKVGPSGSLHVALVEVKDDGTPNISKMLAQATVTQANLKTFPNDWTVVPLEPTFLAQGGRYAVVITTGGNHFVATTVGNNLTSGTLFFGTDGAYQTGDLTKDLMFIVHHAQFQKSTVTVDLTPLQLAGGINHIDLLAPMIVPPSTHITFQVSINNVWKDISGVDVAEGEDSILHELPVLLPFRVVMVGTTDVLPIVDLAKSQVLIERPKTTFKHISTVRTLPGSSTTKQIVVSLNVADFDTVNHTLVAKILHGAGYTTVKTADATVLTEDASRPSSELAYEKKFTFTLGSAISSYKIQIEGTTASATNTFHIEKRTDNTIY